MGALGGSGAGTSAHNAAVPDLSAPHVVSGMDTGRMRVAGGDGNSDNFEEGDAWDEDGGGDVISPHNDPEREACSIDAEALLALPLFAVPTSDTEPQRRGTFKNKDEIL